MSFEKKVQLSFKKAKEDMEGVKNELAFALKRIAHIEESLNRKAIEDLSKRIEKAAKKKKL